MQAAAKWISRRSALTICDLQRRARDEEFSTRRLISRGFSLTFARGFGDSAFLWTPILKLVCENRSLG